MIQKFRRNAFVAVRAERKPWGTIVPAFEAIIDGTYAQLYCGRGDASDRKFRDYSLYILEDGKVVGKSAWHNEGQLSLLLDERQDRDLADELIEEYHKKQH